MNSNPATCAPSHQSLSLAKKVGRLVEGASRPLAPRALKTCPFRTSGPRRPRYYCASQYSPILKVAIVLSRFSLAGVVCLLVAGASRPRAPKALKACPFRTSGPRRPRYYCASQYSPILKVATVLSRRMNRTLSGRTMNPVGRCNNLETWEKLAKNDHFALGGVYKHPQTTLPEYGEPPVNLHTTLPAYGEPSVNPHTTLPAYVEPSVNLHTTLPDYGEPPVSVHTTLPDYGEPPVNLPTTLPDYGEHRRDIHLPSNKQNKP